MNSAQYLSELQKSNPGWVSSQDSLLDVLLTTLTGPACLILRTVIVGRLHNASKITLFFVDCLCFLCPIILSFTLFSNHTLPFLVTIMITTVVVSKEYSIRAPRTSDPYPLQSYGLPFLNNYRALINLGTILAILAVDFPQIFPQRFHKRHNKGFSLMDTGVGSFIFSHALVAPEARNVVMRGSRVRRMRETLVSSSMLIVLGCGRLFVTWATNYAVSEEEYGKHWNFFFTLASVKLAITTMYCVLPGCCVRYSWVLGATVGVLYQLLLTTWGYRDWVIMGDEGDGAYSGGFVHANRPGLFSSLGYCSLYLLGVQVGRYIFTPRPLWRDCVKCLKELTLVAVGAGLLTVLLHHHVDRASRMVANLPFVTWQVSHNLVLLVTAYLVDMFCALLGTQVVVPAQGVPTQVVVPAHCPRCWDRRSAPSCVCLLSAINKNQLCFFLVGNVCTGLVNLTLRTGSVSVGTAFLIIVGYGTFVCGVTCLLFVYNVSTKFW